MKLESAMHRVSDHNEAAALPLSSAWCDLPDRHIVDFSDAPGAWRTALSATFRFPLDISTTSSGPFGSITSVARGPVNLHRLMMKPQIIRSNFDLQQESSLIMLIPLSGTGAFTSRQHQRTIGPADILPIRFWEDFALETSEPFDAVVIEAPLWWLFQKNSGTEALQWISAESLIIASTHLLNTVIIGSARALLKTPSSDIKLQQVIDLFGSVLLHSLNAASPQDNVVPYSRSRFVRIYDYITRNLMKEGLSPQDAADALKISVRTLHLACAEKQTTFNRILSDLRLGYAIYLLLNSDSRISEIAFTVGYGSLPHFCRQFKEKYGISARSYRELKSNIMPS